jgi:hypothetical protein
MPIKNNFCGDAEYPVLYRDEEIMNQTLIELAAYEHYLALSHQNMFATIEGRVSQGLEDQYHKALDEEIKNENM